MIRAIALSLAFVLPSIATAATQPQAAAALYAVPPDQPGAAWEHGQLLGAIAIVQAWLPTAPLTQQERQQAENLLSSAIEDASISGQYLYYANSSYGMQDWHGVLTNCVVVHLAVEQGMIELYEIPQSPISPFGP